MSLFIPALVAGSAVAGFVTAFLIRDEMMDRSRKKAHKVIVDPVKKLTEKINEISAEFDDQ